MKYKTYCNTNSSAFSFLKGPIICRPPENREKRKKKGKEYYDSLDKLEQKSKNQKKYRDNKDYLLAKSNEYRRKKY